MCGSTAGGGGGGRTGGQTCGGGGQGSDPPPHTLCKSQVAIVFLRNTGNNPPLVQLHFVGGPM